MSGIPADDPTTRAFLRHTLATLAYRAGKAVRGTPEAFGQFRPTPDSPACVMILAHMGDLMDWVLRMVQGKPTWTTAAPLTWAGEIARFFAAVRALDEHLASGAPIRWEPGRVFQGGIADALTHTGQLALLRRLSGFKMKGENYSRADIVAGRVGIEQTPPAPEAEFD
ncbi:MAG TPA: hypothetical protein VMS93_09710 [Candidatus Saccharimonadales bacterium]|nr:hypothetical protein [Candidatus Saccharimonadales bacterium]